MARDGANKVTLRAVEVFVAVIEAGSIATGARRLAASPSSVSQQISNLEAALGAKLFDRAARPLTLTPAGFIFQRRALRILDEASRAQSELAELELTSLPRLRVAVIEDFDNDITPELVIKLHDLLPNCNLICHAGHSHENVAALEARREDLVVATDIHRPPEWIEQYPLLREQFVLVTSTGLLTGEGDPVGQLLAAPMVRYTTSQIISQQIEAHLRRLRLAPPQRFEFDSNAAVLAMVSRSRAWTITTPLGYLSAPRVHAAVDVRPLPFKGFARSLSLHARRGVLGALPARVATLLRGLIAEHAVRKLEPLGPWLGQSVQLLDDDAEIETIGR